jgi:hypothetical protein
MSKFTVHCISNAVLKAECEVCDIDIFPLNHRKGTKKTAENFDRKKSFNYELRLC